MSSRLAKASFLVSLFLSSTSVLSEEEEDAYVNFNKENLIQGRVIWIDSCEGCHAYSIADSPNPLKPKQWKDRINKPIEVLYDHAINGYFGPDDSMMPPRGGNNNLSDEQVKLAVDYMKALAEHYINLKETTE